MRVGPVIDRLRHMLGARVRGIDGLAGLAALDEQSLVLPAAYVAPEREEAQGHPRSGVLRTTITQRWAVLLLSPASARHRGQMADEMHDLAAAVRMALIGWRHPDAVTDTVYRGARLLRAERGLIAWQMDFTHQEEWTP